MAENIKIDGYNSQVAPTTPPAAAEFDRGANDLAGINEAIERRYDHSKALSSGKVGNNVTWRR